MSDRFYGAVRFPAWATKFLPKDADDCRPELEPSSKVSCFEEEEACVFRANRPPSPAETGHPVHGNSATRSGATPGVVDVYSDWVSCVNFGLSLRSDSPFNWI